MTRAVAAAPGQRAWARSVLRARPWPAHALRRGVRWLVLAPHADDETLGCGGLIAALATAGGDPHVAFLTDGAGSHVGAPGWGPLRVGGARRGEARRALLALGMRRAPVDLGWPDATPPAAGTGAFRKTVRRLLGYCRRHRVGRIAATWAGEPHCDHVAAAALAAAVAKASGGAIRRSSYLVWGWTLPDMADALAGRSLRTIDVARHRGAARRAIACHRSQTGTRIAGARDAFRLPRAMIALTARPRLLLIEEDGRHAS